MYGEGNGTPLQYSCLKNPMDGGAWWAAVHGVAASDTTEWLHFHFSLSCTGEGNGNPLQFSCLENPRDREAWWAAIYGVVQSRTRLKWLREDLCIYSGNKLFFWYIFCKDFLLVCCLLIKILNGVSSEQMFLIWMKSKLSFSFYS